jgi:hypothetical protein
LVAGELSDRVLAHVARDVYDGRDERAVSLGVGAVSDEFTVDLQIVEGDVLEVVEGSGLRQ